MNPIFPLILGSAALLALGIVLVIAFHNWSYQAGFRDGEIAGRAAGKESGRKDADNWWIGVESEVDQARVKIWREEAER